MVTPQATRISLPLRWYEVVTASIRDQNPLYTPSLTRDWMIGIVPPAASKKSGSCGIELHAWVVIDGTFFQATGCILSVCGRFHVNLFLSKGITLYTL